MQLSQLETIRKDLALQRQKLEDLKVWGSAVILIQAQAAAVARLERQLAKTEEKTAAEPDFPAPGAETSAWR